MLRFLILCISNYYYYDHSTIVFGSYYQSYNSVYRNYNNLHIFLVLDYIMVSSCCLLISFFYQRNVYEKLMVTINIFLNSELNDCLYVTYKSYLWNILFIYTNQCIFVEDLKFTKYNKFISFHNVCYSFFIKLVFTSELLQSK